MNYAYREPEIYLGNGDANQGLTERVDQFRAASRKLDAARRAEMGQYLTPPTTAKFMASLFSDPPKTITLLDPGAGVGTLTAAFVEDNLSRTRKPEIIRAVLYELDPVLHSFSELTLSMCKDACYNAALEFEGLAYHRDFVEDSVGQLRRDLFGRSPATYNRIILNPPYAKIHSQSVHRRLLREIGIETSNLYAGFVALAVQLLDVDGELVAITPRSFCNGPYFRRFRKQMLQETSIRRIHVFDTRDTVFGDDEVLQENVILHLVKNSRHEFVTVSRGRDVSDDTLSIREVAYSEVVRPDDRDLIIRIPANDLDQAVAERISIFTHSLPSIGLSVSTGKVVEFRSTPWLRDAGDPQTLPLIQPSHLKNGHVYWPLEETKRPQALVSDAQTADLFLPAGHYVLVKRFSAKEERKRIVAAVTVWDTPPASQIAFENHLNYYHLSGAGLPLNLAKGLALYLNSTLVDTYFRQFSGHTQVNASDLRMLKYPSRESLERLGRAQGPVYPSQQEIDALLEREISDMTDLTSPDPIAIKQRIAEALAF